jgi:hypothetical protein
VRIGDRNFFGKGRIGDDASVIHSAAKDLRTMRSLLIQSMHGVLPHEFRFFFRRRHVFGPTPLIRLQEELPNTGPASTLISSL